MPSENKVSSNNMCIVVGMDVLKATIYCKHLSIWVSLVTTEANSPSYESKIIHDLLLQTNTYVWG